MRSMQHGAAAVAAALLLGLGNGPALAQGQGAVPTLRVGQSVQGSLVSADPAVNERGRFKLYGFDATEGERYIITMRSSDFDAYVSVARSVAGITETLATDDDSGGGTDARLRFRAPATGSYVILAQSYSSDGLGDFSLQVERAPQTAAVRSIPIQLGQAVGGELLETTALLDDESRYDVYTFSGRSGQRVLIEMRSEEFDAYLYLLRPDGGEGELLATDDDSGGGTDARIRHALPADGQYLIRASAYRADGMGAYTLSLQELPPAPVATPRPLRAGQSVGGELGETSPELDDGTFFDYWSYTARAAERLRISMSSDAFDTYVAIGRLVGGEFQEITYNDDGPEGTDSLLEVTLPGAGTYVIQARSFFSGATGPYTLRVEPAP